MNIEALLVFVVLLISLITFLFMALNRKRNINEESFINKTKARLRMRKEDKLNIDGYKNFYFLVHIILTIIILITIVIFYLSLNGNISDLTEKELQIVAIIASFTALLLLLRINIIDALKERYVYRFDNIKKQHYQISYIVLNIGVLISFIYKLVQYFT